MNAKAMLTLVLALSLVGVGTLGIVTMTESSDGATYEHEAPAGEVFTLSNIPLPQDGMISGNYPAGSTMTMGSTINGALWRWTFSCTPSAGVYEFWMGTPSNPQTNQYILTVTANTPPLDFTNPSAFDMVVGDGLNYQATTNIPATFTKESGALWITVSSSGLVTGTVPSSGPHTIVIKATSTEGPEQTATQTVTITAYDVLTWTTAYGNEIVATEEFRFTPRTNLDSAIYVSGLPAGALYLDGTVRWVPLNAGTYTFTVSASSVKGPTQVIEQTVSLTVYPKLYFTSVPKADMVVIPNGSTIAFYSMSTGATSVLWEFSDGQTSTDFYPEMTFGSGEVTAKLTAFNELGSDTTEVTLNVKVENAEGMSLKQFFEQNSFAIAIVLILALAIACAKFFRRRG